MKTGLKIILIGNCVECPNSRIGIKNSKVCGITKDLINDFDSLLFTSDNSINWFPYRCPLEYYNGNLKLKFMLIDNCQQCNKFVIENDGFNFIIKCNKYRRNLMNRGSGFVFPNECELKDYEI